MVLVLNDKEVDEHYVEKSAGWRHWRPGKSSIIIVIVAAVFFVVGLGVGRGNAEFWRQAAAAKAGPLNYSSVNQVYDILAQDFDGNLSQTKLIDGLKTGLVNAAGDPYTEYFDPAQARALNNELAGQITGIGAELGVNDQNQIVIVSPLSGYPAQKAGLQPNDVITAINGQTTQGMSVYDAVSKIRGKAGTKVTLSISRSGGQPSDITITRQQITVPSVEWHEDGDIGYMKISQFTQDTADLATKAANEFKAKHVKGVVLDLRGNPGGYLSAAVGVSSLWLQPGQTVVSEHRGSTIIDTETATGDDILHGLPTVVLIDGGSASASEITAGALRDNDAAELVGVKSFGKGSVQQVEQLSDGGELKVTIARWYTPDGKNIDKQGLMPAVTVKNTEADTKAGQDPQKDKAYAILQSKI